MYNFLTKIFGSSAQVPSRIPPSFNRSLTRAQWYREIDTSLAESQAIIDGLQTHGIQVTTQRIDLEAFSNWVTNYGWSVPIADLATLPADIAEIAPALRYEKLLEYYLSTSICEFKQGANVADLGSAESDFLKLLTKEHGVQGWAVDPCLVNYQSQNPNIQCIPDIISTAAARLPSLDAITLHCSFEMFAPSEMAAVISTASKKLVQGGKCVISPLYLAPTRRIYVDAAAQPFHDYLNFDTTTAEIVGVKDYWSLSWSEWLASSSLFHRLVKPFPELDFQIVYIDNAKDVYPGCFLHFVGVWSKK